MFVLVKVIVEYFFTSKKAAERRCASRSLLRVSMLVASTCASTQELAGFCSSILSRPLSIVKRPLIVLIAITRTVNETCEWVESISQFIVILLVCLFRAYDHKPTQPYKWSYSAEWLERTLGTNGMVVYTQIEGRGLLL